MFGQPSLASTLKLPALQPFTQRVGTWINLDPLCEESAFQYIEWQVKTAGSEKEIFAKSAKKAIFRVTQGNLRSINRIAWESLNQGFLDGAEHITEEIISHVCKYAGPHISTN